MTESSPEAPKPSEKLRDVCGITLPRSISTLGLTAKDHLPNPSKRRFSRSEEKGDLAEIPGNSTPRDVEMSEGFMKTPMDSEKHLGACSDHQPGPLSISNNIEEVSLLSPVANRNLLSEQTRISCAETVTFTENDSETASSSREAPGLASCLLYTSPSPRD